MPELQLDLRDFFILAHFTFHIHSFPVVFIYFFSFFLSHAEVLRTELMHEFFILYCLTE